MSEPIVILGAGGHAAVLAEALVAAGHEIHAVAVTEGGAVHSTLAGLPRLTDDELAARFAPGEVVLVNGVGSLPGSTVRERLFADYRSRGFAFASVVSPHATVSPSAVIAEGAQVMAGAVLQAGVVVGPNAIVNTGAIVDHDVIVGADSHLAPGTVLSGGVDVGVGVHVGTGASVIQGISLGERCVIGAGASVVRDVPARAILLPARPTVREGTV